MVQQFPHTQKKSDDSEIITTYAKYDKNGNMRFETNGNGAVTKYLYEYDKVVLELDGSGSQTGRNVYGTNLLMRTADGTTYYYMYNGHADVTALLTPDGTIAGTYYYDAFGNITEQNGDVNNSITYAGYQYDEETGLYYLNARMYDPKIARFLQEDTYRGQLDDPLSLNLYVYCFNNPIMYWDPTGHIYFDGKEWRTSLSDEKGKVPEPNTFVVGNMSINKATGKMTLTNPKEAVTAELQDTLPKLAIVFGSVNTSSSGSTELYRSVSLLEYGELVNSGKFSSGKNGLSAKFFAESYENAIKWGDALNGRGNYKVIKINVPNKVANDPNKFIRWERLDGIGPARAAECSDLNKLKLKVLEVNDGNNDDDYNDFKPNGGSSSGGLGSGNTKTISDGQGYNYIVDSAGNIGRTTSYPGWMQSIWSPTPVIVDITDRHDYGDVFYNLYGYRRESIQGGIPIMPINPGGSIPIPIPAPAPMPIPVFP